MQRIQGARAGELGDSGGCLTNLRRELDDRRARPVALELAAGSREVGARPVVSPTKPFAYNLNRYWSFANIARFVRRSPFVK